MSSRPNCDPQHYAPTNYAKCLEHVLGTDRNGDQAHLEKRHGILFGPDGNVCARWADGSDERPIFLPDLKEDALGGIGAVVKGADGRIYAVIPADNTDRILMSKAGAVFFEDANLNKTSFPRDEIDEATGCSDKVAVLEDCDNSGYYRLRWVSRETIFGCEAMPTGEEGAHLIVCDGSLKRIPATAKNQILVSNGSSWVLADRGLSAFYRSMPIYNGVDGILTFSWNNLNPPPNISGQMVAEFEVTLQISRSSGSAATALYFVYNGAQVHGIQAYGTETSHDRFSYSAPVTSGGSFTIQGLTSGDLTGVTSIALYVSLLRYFA